MERNWSSRERVRASLEHRESDRVPINLRITVPAYQQLRRYLGFLPEDSNPNIHLEEAQLSLEIASFLGVDLTCISLRSLPGSVSAPGEVFYDLWHIGRRVTELRPGYFSLDTVVSPLKFAGLEDLRDFNWPDPKDPALTVGLEEEAKRIFTETDLAIVGCFGGSILGIARDLRGEAQWREDLLMNPDFACALLNRIAGLQIDLDDAGLRAAGKYLSLLEIREGATNLDKGDRLQFSHDIWKQTIRPVLERRWKAARLAFTRYAINARLMLTIDTPPLEIYQDLVDGGVELVGALQPGIPEVDFGALKRDIGGQLSFYGGVDARELLHFGSENDVRQQVKACLEELRLGGGFILSPSQILQVDARPQNIVAMCETVKVYGCYSSE